MKRGEWLFYCFIFPKKIVLFETLSSNEQFKSSRQLKQKFDYPTRVALSLENSLKFWARISYFLRRLDN
jgi:hypothetical protein